MKIYAMSDIHGCLDAFLDALSLVDLEDKNNKLVLCGDYIHGGFDSYAVVEKIIELKKKYKSKVVVLMGNHEHWVIEQGMPIVDEYRDEGEYDEKRENKCIDFISQMELYYKYKNEVLFCHAGVDEEAGEYWEQGTSDYHYIEKFPPDKGTFCINIVAGHVSTASPYLANNYKFRGIYYDGCSHYYIDGDVLKNGVVPVLMYDTDAKKFYEVTELENKELKHTNKNKKIQNS